MDETYIMNAVKEKCCFVSQDFYRDLETARGCSGGRGVRSNPLGLEYVLPDFTHSKQGFIRGRGGDVEQLMSDTQILPLCNERFAIPEALFHPTDIGLEQGGLHETVIQAVNACPEATRGVLLSNILLVGGTAALPGLEQRLQSEVQALAPCRVQVTAPQHPALQAWQGGRSLARGTAAAAGCGDWRLTREQYEEIGPDRTVAHFEGFD
ncbi:Actin- protein 6 [Linderina pennispora]|nr:Actin- protein 6 [Linderina pennispora]